jgi:hypothetical protein
MTEWAGQAAQRTLEQKRLRDQNTERANRVAKIKTEGGPRLFRQLFDWLDKEATSYDSELARGSDDADQLTVTMIRGSAPQVPDDVIVIARHDGKKNPVKIRYSTALGQLSYECEGRRETLVLKVDDDDQPFFETEFRERKTVEQIGKEILDKFLAAKF